MASVWDLQPDETPKSFAAFSNYLTYPTNERSLAKVARWCKHSSDTTVEQWSVKYNWVARSLAFDEYITKSAIEVRRVGLTEAQVSLVQQTSLVVMYGVQLGLKMLTDLNDKFEDAGFSKVTGVDTRDYARVVRALADLDTLSRRNLGLPTNFKTESVTEPDADGDVYFIGS